MAENHLCHVPGQGTRQRCHSLPCVKSLAHSKQPLFAVCQAVTAHDKRPFQRGSEHCTLFCRGPRKALGKVFAMCPKCSTRQTSSLPAVVCRELFAVCPWHTTNGQCPIVSATICKNPPILFKSGSKFNPLLQIKSDYCSN